MALSLVQQTLLYFDSGHWFKLHRAFFYEFESFDDIVVLCWLLDRAGRCVRSGEFREEQDGEVLSICCPVKSIKNDLILSVDRQQDVLRRLTKKGVISISMRGGPAKRWITIDFRHISEMLERFCFRVGNSADPRVGNSADPIESFLPKGKKSSYYKRSAKSKISPTPGFLSEFDAKELSEEETLARKFKESIKPYESAVNIRWHASKQARAIARGLKERERYREVLDWYLSNYSKRKELKLPSCPSPTQFLRRFQWISDVYDRQPKEIKLSKRGQEIYDRVKQLGWPKESLKHLPAAIESGLHFFPWVAQVAAALREDYQARIERALRKGETTHRGRDRRWEWYYDRMYNLIRHMDVENALREYHETIRDWEQWSGKIPPYDLNNKQFNERMASMSQEYSTAVPYWDGFRKELHRYASCEA